MKEYSNTTIGPLNSDLRDKVCLPPDPNNYLPDLVGTWMGIKISNVEEAVCSVIASKFRTNRREKMEEGRFIFHPE